MKWVRFILWNPLEFIFTRFPLVQLKVETINHNDHVTQIKIHNVVTRAISKFGGGYDYSSIYLVGHELLIDTGFSWSKKSFEKFIMQNGYNKTLKYVINSHAHEDHIGNNDIIEKYTKASIYAHSNAIATIKHPPKLPWYRSFMFGANTFSNVEQVPNSISFLNFNFEVIHTPGHSSCHICLYEKNNKWLFSGDLYVAPDLDSQLQDVNGPDWIKSLKKIILLDISILFDGHGAIITGKENINKALKEKLYFLERIKEKVIIESKNPMHLEDITKKVFQDKTFINSISFNEGWLSILTNSDFSRTNLVRSFLINPDTKDNNE